MTEALFPRFSAKEYRRRRGLVSKMMKNEGLEALLIFAGPVKEARMFYLSNYAPQVPTWLVYSAESEPTLLLHMYNHIENARAMSVIRDIRWYGPDPAEKVVQVLAESRLASSTIGVVGLTDIVPYGPLSRIMSKLPGANFKDASQPYDAIREIKSEEELVWHKKSARLTDATMMALRRETKPGQTEHDLASIIHDSFVPRGGQLGIHFISSTSMKSPNRSVPWQFLTSRRIRKGDVVTTEITVKYWTYESQLHRPLAVGKEPSKLYRKLFDVALECYESVARALKPGSTTQDVLAASDVIHDKGYSIGDSLVHGAEAGKNPELGTRDSVYPPEPYTFKENTVVVIQPLPVDPVTNAGLQLGAAVVITPQGAKSLHEYPLEFSVCKL